jgi:hypothetical protein
VKSKSEVITEELENKIFELSDTVLSLDEENASLKDVIASQQWDATPFEKDYILTIVKELREQIRLLEITNQALKDSRDMYQNRNDDLQRTVNSLKNKLK